MARVGKREREGREGKRRDGVDRGEYRKSNERKVSSRWEE